MQLSARLVVDGDKALHDTIIIANSACQRCIDIGYKSQTYNKTRLHQQSYKKVRAEYPKLNSSLVTAMRDQASDMLKRLKLEKRPRKKPLSSIRLNHNTFKFFPESRHVSISTVEGRRTYDVRVPSYFEKYTLTESTSARIWEVRGKFVLDLIIEVEPGPEREPNSIIGVDRGIYNPAVTSDNQFFNSKKVREVKGRYTYLKRQLQRAGTRSAKRHLKKLAGRERRFIADTNHCISKRIVESDCDAIALEDLSVAALKMRKHRRKKNGPTKNKMRHLLGSWSPDELRTFIEYKAELRGKKVFYVNSHYTSRACNNCGDIRTSNRKGRRFKCAVCGYSLDSDLNAARNIAALARGTCGRLSVNQPIATCDEPKAALQEELRASIVASHSSMMCGS